MPEPQGTNRDFGWCDAARVRWPERVIDIDDIRSRFGWAAEFLDERGRRLFAANEALAHGSGGVTATAAATVLARSTINRGIRDLRSASNPIGSRIRPLRTAISYGKPDATHFHPMTPDRNSSNSS